MVDWEAAFFEGTDRSGTDHLLSKLDEYAAQWDGGFVWQAPFAAVVQSSGWGKSWSMCQLRSYGVFVVYCSLMKPGYTGYPPRSTVAKCLEAQQMSEALVCAYLRASLEVLAESDLSPEQWLECQIRSDVVGKAILQRHTALLPEMKNAQLRTSLLGAVSAMREKKKTKLRQGNVQVVFVFDEGSGLKDFPASFPVFRHGLGHLPVGGGVFALLADTHASISDFDPHRAVDPTGRSRKLFDPIHLIGKADLFVGGGSGSDTDSGYDPGYDPQRLEQLFSFGRPLWGVQYMKSHGSADARLRELVRFAVWKLLGGRLRTTLSDYTRLDAAAVFMACIGPEVLTRSYLAQNLVAGHMATCIATADERRQIITVHTSEAVLGEAAAFILHKMKFLVLGFLAELVTEGLVLQRARGELVMRIILLLCMHKCVDPVGWSVFRTGPVTIRTFLQTMFGANWDASKCESSFLDAEVCFNHFIPMCSSTAVTKSRLRQFLDRGAAILYPRQEFASEIGIPWRLGDEVGIFEFRVKNWVKFGSQDASDARNELKLRHKELPGQDEPPMVIVNLGGEDEDLETVTAAWGISAEIYPFLDEKVVAALNRLLAAKPDFRAHVKEHEVELVQAMAVLSL